MGVFGLVYKREQLAQMAYPIIATLTLIITTTKGGGFYFEFFCLCTLEYLGVQIVKGIYLSINKDEN